MLRLSKPCRRDSVASPSEVRLFPAPANEGLEHSTGVYEDKGTVPHLVCVYA
jgi:hypothetical protein